MKIKISTIIKTVALALIVLLASYMDFHNVVKNEDNWTILALFFLSVTVGAFIES